MQYSFHSVLLKLVSGQHLTQDESQWYINELMDGNADPLQVSAVLATQQQLGLTAQEIAGAASAMVNHAQALLVQGETTDIVGTGGDGAHTVNLSTMGSIIAAAAGVKIVKHGNRAASSKCGAADCLEALGLPLDLTPDEVAEVGNEVGITFAFAKTFHPAMRFVAPIRSALGIPCVFNVLGPLTNPANPKHVAIGCANVQLAPLMAQVYADRGQTGMVYTSNEGLDELAPTGPVKLWVISDGTISEHDFDPIATLGLTKISVEDLRGGEPLVNAQAVRDLLAGKDVPFRSTALLNAASAIVADGTQMSKPTIEEQFVEAYALAEEAVDSGKAQNLLERWITVANRIHQA